jgi:hypothetical protein
LALDQFVTGLLATPCIRRRLDKLYGNAPRRSLSEDGRLDLLSHAATPAALAHAAVPSPLPQSPPNGMPHGRGWLG